MRLKTNLATRRYINLRAVNLSLAVVFAILGAFLLYQVQRVAYDAGELKRLEQSAAVSSATQVERTEVVGDAQYKALMTRINFANQALAKKSVNWLMLLDRLESVVPPGVALDQIVPDQKNQVVKLSGITRDFATLRTFLENLEQSPNFSEVYLLSQSEAKVGSTQQGLLFSLSCKVPLQ